MTTTFTRTRIGVQQYREYLAILSAQYDADPDVQARSARRLPQTAEQRDHEARANATEEAFSEGRRHRTAFRINPHDE